MGIEHMIHEQFHDRDHETVAVQAEAIPGELHPYAHWVCWRYVDRGQGRKPDKQPVNPRTLHNAGVHWPNTWSQFETAYQAYTAYRQHGIQGIGFMLTPDDPYVAVDLDSCIQENGIAEPASEIITTLNSYTEISPSGHGIRILLACPEFQTNHRHPQLEVYSHARYVTITGHHVAGTPPEITVVSPDQLTTLLPQTVAEPQPSPPVVDKQMYSAVAGQALWERIFAHGRLGDQHLRRFQGDLSLDGGDHSLTVKRIYH